MIGRVKKWLGIEGVKLSAKIHEPIPFGTAQMDGHFHFHSMRSETVESVYCNVKEIYTRGRGKNKRTDEFLMGELTVDGPIRVSAGEEISVPFTLELEWYISEMDEMERDNAFSRQAARLAKWMKGVKSTYLLTAEAYIEGTKLHPFTQKELQIR